LLVIGDMMLDQFIWGTANRISPEAPVPVVRIERESVHLGGAGNVVHNLISLGARVVCLGVIGDDEAGRQLAETLEQLGVGATGLIQDSTRPTTLKTRIIAHHQQVVRADRETRQPLHPSLTGQLVALFADQLAHIEGVIISDYDKGIVTPSLLEQILPMAREAGKPVFIDPKIRNFTYYSPVTVLKPNQRETEAVTHIEITDEISLQAAGRAIMRMMQCDYLLVTRGEAGMTLFSGDDQLAHIPATAREVYDVTGAGDTTIAALALSFVSGATPVEAAIIANDAAGVVIGKIGTATVTPHELRNAVHAADH
jgi:D-beta-D-heptose 7-phosphate kinase/D-beta-D-heptose 1-phosphate adenosyltransferase